MDKMIYFNSSLPRAGSTLFSNIVAQNPKFYCTPTSGLLELVNGAKYGFNQSPEFKAQEQELMAKGFLSFCKEGINGYFNALTDKPFVLDKSRGWGINYNFAKLLVEEPKIVCMVRDLRSIFASMEKNFRKNPYKENFVQNPSQLVGTTLRKRIDIWASGVPVGISVDRLKDIIEQGIDKNILFIRYEDLMDNPEEEMNRFYEFINQDVFQHNFVNITQHTHENDVVHGIYGDHKLRPKFEKKEDDFMEVLGFEICRDIKQTYKWFYDYFHYI